MPLEMKKILIIDDEEGIVDEVRGFFIEEGFDVYTATTGREGVDLINKIRPDILLLDIKLPDLPGLSILKVSKEISPNTKVIVNTGYVDQNLIDQAERLGRDAFLQKPFNLELLKSEVDRLLGV
jgi:two-component system response regulator (stage 0 sporulation protein F)